LDVYLVQLVFVATACVVQLCPEQRALIAANLVRSSCIGRLARLGCPALLHM